MSTEPNITSAFQTGLLKGLLGFHIDKTNYSVRAEQINSRLRFYPRMVFSQLAIAFLLVGIMRNGVSHRILLAWLVLACAAHTIELVYWLRFHEQTKDMAQCRRWSVRFSWFSGIVGVIWGSAGILMFVPGEFLYQTFLICVVLGIFGGAVTSNLVHPPSLFIYLAGLVLPLVIRIFMEGDWQHLLLGGMLLIYILFVLSAARESILTFEQSILRRIENEILAAKLEHAQFIAHIGSWHYVLATGKLTWTEDFYRVFGVPPDAFVPSFEAFINLIHPDNQAAMQAWFAALTSGEKPHALEFRCVRTDGTIRHLESHGELILNAEGKPSYIIGTCKDITERKQREADLLLTQFASDHASDCILWIDKQARICYANIAARRELGYTQAELLAMSIPDFDPNFSAAAWPAHWEELQQQGTLAFETVHRRKDGSIFPVDISANFLKFDGKEFNVAYARNITERKRIEQEIRNLAFHDALTGLPNRRLLNDRLSQSMANSKRDGLYCALIFLDLDNFKTLNDTYGHDAGDLLLQEAAHRISSCVREADTVARFGGDEFAVVLNGLEMDEADSAKSANTVSEKIRAALAEPYVLKKYNQEKLEVIIKHNCTSSLGVVMFTNHEANTEDVIKWGDAAMYQAKEAGRNQIRFYRVKG